MNVASLIEDDISDIKNNIIKGDIINERKIYKNRTWDAWILAR